MKWVAVVYDSCFMIGVGVLAVVFSVFLVHTVQTCTWPSCIRLAWQNQRHSQHHTPVYYRIVFIFKFTVNVLAIYGMTSKVHNSPSLFCFYVYLIPHEQKNPWHKAKQSKANRIAISVFFYALDIFCVCSLNIVCY